MESLKLATSTEIPIEKGIPVSSGGKPRRNKYPFREMEVGDSFLFPSGLAEATYYGQAREFTKQFTIEGDRRVFKTGKTNEGYRCWRVS